MVSAVSFNFAKSVYHSVGQYLSVLQMYHNIIIETHNKGKLKFNIIHIILANMIHSVIIVMTHDYHGILGKYQKKKLNSTIYQPKLEITQTSSKLHCISFRFVKQKPTKQKFLTHSRQGLITTCFRWTSFKPPRFLSSQSRICSIHHQIRNSQEHTPSYNLLSQGEERTHLKRSYGYSYGC